ncbi:MAG TPA: HEAT repeat domain-containing protein [Terriglobales bacterium]|jgi:hypothetical protein|nr:HEAT repeat domain-containing protein [Terriglobales bacterium]
MSDSDRDPLFFPPHKQPELPPEEEEEGYSAEVDPAGQQRRLRAIVVVGLVVLGFFLLSLQSESVKAAWAELRISLGLAGEPVSAGPAKFSEHELEQLDRLPAQVQAQKLLERAINHYEGAAGEIERRVDGWRGHIAEDQRLFGLVQTALNSNDLRVRAAALEVDLAARGTTKDAETVQRMVQQAEPGRDGRIQALWALGALANRGIEPDAARQALTSYLHDPQEEVRYWAVEGLALTGQDESVAPLLDVLRTDSSGRVRERAACSLAQSGMLAKEQRMRAVPELMNMADDPALDPSTRKWVFQALRDITGQGLGDDAAAWRNWWSVQSRS